MNNTLYKKIDGIDIYSIHGVDEESFIPKVRFYMFENNRKRFFKCEYNLSKVIDPNDRAEKELIKIIDEELSAEIKKYIK